MYPCLCCRFNDLFFCGIRFADKNIFVNGSKEHVAILPNSRNEVLYFSYRFFGQDCIAYGDCSAFKRIKPCKKVRNGRLSAAGNSDQRCCGSMRNRKRNIIDYGFFGISKNDIFKDDIAGVGFYARRLQCLLRAAICMISFFRAAFFHLGFYRHI